MPLSFAELVVILGLIALMSLECVIAIRSRSWVQVYRPTLFIAVVLAFYVLVGPLRAILSVGEAANYVGTSGTTFRGLDHRPLLIWGWLGALVFYGSLLVGFHAFRPSSQPRRLMLKADLSSIRTWGQILCLTGLLMYFALHGLKIFYFLNPFDPTRFDKEIWGFSGFQLGFASNYFSLAINFLIPGILIQYAVWLRQRKHLYVVLAWLAVATLIYLSEAFRYRILFLYIPILLLWLFYNKRRPMLIMLLAFMIGFVSLNGLIGLARTQIRGLDVTKVSQISAFQVITSSFEEAGTFFVSSAVIESVPRKIEFLGFKPLYTAVLQPLPRLLFPGKPAGKYASEIPDEIYAVSWNGWKTHAAFLSYAEYYLMFGWSSLVAVSFCIGLALKRLWNWFLFRQYEPLAQAVYLLNASFLYVLISRGYFAQIVVLYAFTVLPSYLIYRKMSERVQR